MRARSLYPALDPATAPTRSERHLVSNERELTLARALSLALYPEPQRSERDLISNKDLTLSVNIDSDH
jgi:hypothetical protein